MAWSPRFGTAWRVLKHYYWTKMRADRGARTVKADRGDRLQILSTSARDARIRVVARASGAAQLTTDAGVCMAFPGADGIVDVDLPGMRHLRWYDSGRQQTFDIPLYGRRDHLLCTVRTIASLATFPFRHAIDLRDYFLHGDSAAGDRIERALLPLLAQPERFPIAADGFFGATQRMAPRATVTPPPAVTIVVPVYNAFDVLQLCLDRLIRNTAGPCRFLLINDASPDPRIRPYLDTLSARDDRIEVLHNDANLGFVGTVNRGLGLATGHVVLLNSDALVPEDWLARLVAPILADDSVASVTPMSNDAEIFNAPVECRPRQLGPGEAEAADRMAARLDWRTASADVPTGVGFCMAIARDWLDRTGALDPVFGRGYGEEVDWCRRAAAQGGRNIGIATLFVEHRSGSSFGAEKTGRVHENGRIISARYPDFDLSVAQWREADPLVGPRLALGLALLDHATAFPVYLAHRLGGGAEHWLSEQLAQDIATQGGALVLRDDPDSGRTLAELHSAQGATRGLLLPDDVVRLLSVPGKIRLTYSCLVAARDPLAFIRRCVAALRPQDELRFIFHDFLPLCPSYCLISATGSYCGLPAAKACQSCYEALPQTAGTRPARISEWREGWKSLIERAQNITVFSVNSQNLLSKVWPDLAPRIEVKPHAPGHLPARVSPRQWSEGERITVGILGGIGRQKGAALLQDLARQGDTRIRLVVIGEIDPAYAHPAIAVHGRYKRDEIHLLAESYGIDVWLIPSIWPETYCYTAHECLATGLPTFSFDIGAQAEALRAAPNGHVLPLGQPLGRASFDIVAG